MSNLLTGNKSKFSGHSPPLPTSTSKAPFSTFHFSNSGYALIYVQQKVSQIPLTAAYKPLGILDELLNGRGYIRGGSYKRQKSQFSSELHLPPPHRNNSNSFYSNKRRAYIGRLVIGSNILLQVKCVYNKGGFSGRANNRK